MRYSKMQTGLATPLIPGNADRSGEEEPGGSGDSCVWASVELQTNKPAV